MMTMSGSTVTAPPGANNNAAMPQHRSRPEDAALHITVSDPVQHHDGMNKYTSYRVDVRPITTTAPDGVPQDVVLGGAGGGSTYSSVLRRYSDFLWLSEQLQVERAGAIVPPLPEKQPVGRFSPAFVEDRRCGLERFLRRVALHPELADATALDTFLRADDVSFHAAKQASKKNSAANPMMMQQSQMMPYATAPGMGSPAAAAGPLSSSKKDGLKRWFAEAKTSMTGDLIKSPDDDLFDEIGRYVAGLDNQMRNVSQQAVGLVRKGKEIANGLFEFGLAFQLLGQSEADVLGDALQKMGDTADQLSVLSAEHAEQERTQFEEPLQDYIKTIAAVKLALHRRHERRLSYSTCLKEVESKQMQLAKLRQQIGQEAKAYSTELSLRRAQEAAEVAREDFAVVSQRVLREVDRFKREKAEEMRKTVLDYINLQVEYNKRMEVLWATLIPRLEQVQLDNASVASNPAASSSQVNAGAPVTPDPSLPQQQGVVPQQQPPYSPQQQAGGLPPQQQAAMPSVGMGTVPSPAAAPPVVPAPPGGGGNISVQYREAPPPL